MLVGPMIVGSVRVRYKLFSLKYVKDQDLLKDQNCLPFCTLTVHNYNFEVRNVALQRIFEKFSKIRFNYHINIVISGPTHHCLTVPM